MQPSADSTVHEERFIGTLHGRERRSLGGGLSAVLIRLQILGGHRLLIPVGPRLRGGARAKLHRQVDLGGGGPDLNLAAQMIEAKQVGLHDPLPRRHSIELKLSVISG